MKSCSMVNDLGYVGEVLDSDQNLVVLTEPAEVLNIYSLGKCSNMGVDNAYEEQCCKYAFNSLTVCI